ncbi:MAG TPA: SMP-30/gluconolactonase/LRE family protein [Vicinamibacterales bacterium]|nr:SMP-30/gluconolactonase/LRE family protein [Vicinamibacterales bacterium]
MKGSRFAAAAVAAVGLLAAQVAAAQHAVGGAPIRRPDATIDLKTTEGVALVRGQWRYRDARLVETDFNAPGPDMKPTGPIVKTLAHAFAGGSAEVNESDWPAIEPTSLEARRTNGRFSFAWYRLDLTIPERAGSLDTGGTTVVFEIVVDDYAEVWVNGELPRPLGQTGGALVRGFNAPNRVVLTRDARPGQRIQLAVFAANGPLSDPPPNYVWVRSATLDFFKRSVDAATTPARVARLDPALDAIVAADAQIEKLAEGFLFTEGPVWSPEGYLLFSDPNANTIYRWSDDDGLSVFRSKSGYSGTDIGEYGQPGSNGLAIDPEGRLTINEHGNRRVTRLEKNGVLTVLADRFEGRRFNSPNDLVYASDGSLYFTDPPFGLPGFAADPRKELPYSGVYRWSGGQVRLLTRDLDGPNGIALSPDERFLYVGNWDERKKVVMRYPIEPDGSISDGAVFADLTDVPGEDAIDGVKVDQAGNVYVSGPGGLWIFSPGGRRLGTIIGPEHIHNFAWGDRDGRALYLAARTGLYRLRLEQAGRPAVAGTLD